MTLMGRLFVRGAVAAGAVGAAVVIALAPQAGVATTRSLDDHAGGAHVQIAQPPASAACTAARNAFITALKADVSEDATERDLARTGADAGDPAEDQAEHASFRSLLNAMRSACEPAQAGQPPTTTKPAPSAACTGAKAALQSFATQLRAQEQAEWANHTEGTAADRTEDQAAFAQLKTLLQAAATACGFNTFGHDSR